MDCIIKNVDAGHSHQHHPADMVGRARAGRGKVKLAGPLFGICNEFAHVAGRQAAGGDQRIGHIGREPDGCEILVRVVADAPLDDQVGIHQTHETGHGQHLGLVLAGSLHQEQQGDGRQDRDPKDVGARGNPEIVVPLPTVVVPLVVVVGHVLKNVRARLT